VAYLSGRSVSLSAEARMTGLDATRGAAMLFVCLSHFGYAFVRPADPGLYDGIERFTYLATPSFVLISGVVLGFLYSRHEHAFDDLRLKLTDRALLLLTVVHLVIVIAHIPMAGISQAWDATYITDTLGLCLLVGTLVISILGAWSRVAVGAVLYVTASVLLFLWTPTRPVAEMLKQVLVGRRAEGEARMLTSSFPFLPWLGVYLATSAIGEHLGRCCRARRRMPAAALALAGGLSMALAGALRLSRALIRPDWRSTQAAEFVTRLGQKQPPGPTYLGWYLGAALVVVSAGLLLENWGSESVAVRPLLLIGRNSLCVFVAQYFLYYAILPHHLRFGALWPLAFLFTVLVLLVSTYAWQAAGGHRLLTVGYPGLVHRARLLTRTPSWVKSYRSLDDPGPRRRGVVARGSGSRGWQNE
jgi:uncharacterized membrane protein